MSTLRGSVNRTLGGPAVLIALLSTACATAEETVHLRSEFAAGGGLRLRGEIERFNGQGLVIRTGDRAQEYPAERVERIEYAKLPVHEQAEALLAAGEYRGALARYREAIDAEQRIWVRREILSQMIRCYQAMGQTVGAAETFLVLLRSDPQSPYFVQIPLDWTGTPPTQLTEQRALQWLAANEPVARLMGASWLLSTNEHLMATAALNELAGSPDPRIRQLAAAQLWRGDTPGSDVAPAMLDAVVEQLPEALRAGPYYAAGRRLVAAHQPDEALLRLLRVPINYGEQRELAALALLTAGNVLAGQNRGNEAATLYAELIRDYAEQPAAAEAERQLIALRSAAGSR